MYYLVRINKLPCTEYPALVRPKIPIPMPVYIGIDHATFDQFREKKSVVYIALNSLKSQITTKYRHCKVNSAKLHSCIKQREDKTSRGKKTKIIDGVHD